MGVGLGGVVFHPALTMRWMCSCVQDFNIRRAGPDAHARAAPCMFRRAVPCVKGAAGSCGREGRMRAERMVVVVVFKGEDPMRHREKSVGVGVAVARGIHHPLTHGVRNSSTPRAPPLRRQFHGRETDHGWHFSTTSPNRRVETGCGFGRPRRTVLLLWRTPIICMLSPGGSPLWSDCRIPAHLENIRPCPTYLAYIPR